MMINFKNFFDKWACKNRTAILTKGKFPKFFLYFIGWLLFSFLQLSLLSRPSFAQSCDSATMEVGESIRACQIEDLRTLINSARVACATATILPFPFVDEPLVPGVHAVSKRHLEQLRQALVDITIQCPPARPAPVFTPATLAASDRISLSHFVQVYNNAVIAAFCGDSICQTAVENIGNCPVDCGGAAVYYCGNTLTCYAAAACPPGLTCYALKTDCLDNAETDCDFKWFCTNTTSCNYARCPLGAVCYSDQTSCEAGAPTNCFCGDGACAGIENCYSCPEDCGACPFCGDGSCNGSEDCSSCPVDCGVCPYCGDGLCSNEEDDCITCVPDCGVCPYCGDGNCDYPGGEECTNCVPDCGPCPYCGDGRCDWAGVENCSNCASDCGACAPSCGDGNCDLIQAENCSTCPEDCGACIYCGDGLCSGGEDCTTCVADCGTCSTCGDGRCNYRETCSNCPTDCGPCGAACGDGTCNGSETCLSCPGDCGPCPPPPPIKCRQFRCKNNRFCEEGSRINCPQCPAGTLPICKDSGANFPCGTDSCPTIVCDCN